ncbi:MULTISPECIES: hypothetical protein [unclassified Bradyrhizobium]|uniref:hypothetical protein n=1 Tax=unclassified Bradyrhizobium TaxID=2631580 RepID=UPI0028E5EC62|nr:MULTISPECIES: hypothetical protein [unclassified Bradyrhizobium]
MALLAEQLVDEWLNRIGFFTVRGIKSGVNEIDLLGVRPRGHELEGWHVEVQVSFRPVSYIGRLSKEDQAELGAKSASSAKRRPQAVIAKGIQQWIEKKFYSIRKQEMREQCWKGMAWKHKFVHGVVLDRIELQMIEQGGIELISFHDVLRSLCEHKPGELFGGAGTDIAEIMRYFANDPEQATLQAQ